jgi:GNAT superfamily N-acetyltransferase
VSTIDPGALPTLDVLVDVADAGLHPWVREHVLESVRRAALAEELGYRLDTAARDLTYAADFARAAPDIGQPPEAYLDRWLALDADAHVLAGPRYLGMNPDLPFVGIAASDRQLRPGDRNRLQAMATQHFAAFCPGFVMLTTADPVGAWPDTRAELRQVIGLLADLRRQPTPPELAAVPRADTDFYDRYHQIHQRHVAREPDHARHTRCEDRADLQQLADRGFLFDVRVDDEWAGVLAAEPDARRGVRGATVVELLLDDRYRGRGYGRHLSTLLAQGLPLGDDEYLMGTIHYDNTRSYRSALAAGRLDVGGEIIIPL